MLRVLDLFHLNGVLTFPSFHAASAILYAWGAWPIRWLRPFSLLGNGAMLLSTPIGGGHFLVDVLAGIVVATAAIYAARWIGGSLSLRAQAKVLTPVRSFG
jgi:membrane-associated phospholipid phosphatase